MNDVSDLIQFAALHAMCDEAQSLSPIVTAVAEAAQLGGIDKFDPSNAEQFVYIGDDVYGLQVIAECYAARYRGNFAYMLDMKGALNRFHSLTAPQAKGVLNCMLAEARRNAPKTTATPIVGGPVKVVLEDGMYKLGETIYKVQHAVHGSGKQYAKALVRGERWAKDGDGKEVCWNFEYAPGAISKLSPADRMTLDEAKAFGALYGTCCVCGRTLTDEVSIAAGIGPVCAGRV